MSAKIVSIAFLVFASLHHQYSAGQACPKQATSDGLKSPCKINSSSLIVTYENKTVQCDEQKPLTHYSAKTNPPVTYSLAQTGKSYVLAMVDPDAPIVKQLGQYFLHWLVAGIKGKDFAKGQLGNASVLMSYVPPGPPPMTGVHAYRFFVFEQPEGKTLTLKSKLRAPFDLVKFANTNGLCAPIAATQFHTQANA